MQKFYICSLYVLKNITKVAKVESKSSPSLTPIPANQLRIIKTVVVPYFIAIYMADSETADPWRHLTPKDFDTLEELCLRACGEPLGHTIDENAEIVKLVHLYRLSLNSLHLCANVVID
jgi:hypothetical protein